MRRLKSALMAAAVTALLLMVGTVSAFACTGVYIGKGVSTDGSAMIARSEDQTQGVVNKRFQVVARVDNKTGRYLEVYGAGTKFELPATTYKYTMVQDYQGAYGDYAGCCVNENGVAVTATVSSSANAAIKANDKLNGDVEEAMIANYVASVATSAKDGVQKLGALIAARGSNESNVIMLVDQKEAWYMEMYTGHHWAAVKMPEDCVAVYGNNFMLGTNYNPNDPTSFLCSKGLFDYVKNVDGKGTDVGVYEEVNGEKKLNLVKTFGNKPLSAGNQTRNWGGHHILAPSTAGSYDADKYYDLFYKPDKKVSPTDVFSLMRYRLEDTNLYGQRGIGTEMSSQVHVLQVFSDMPAECDALEWICLGNAEHSVFVPSWSGITDVHDTYKAAQNNDYNAAGAYFKFKQICSLAEQNRDRYGTGVRNIWKLYENMFYDYLMDHKADLQKTYEKDGRAVGDAYVTKLSKDMAGVVFDQADRLYTDLLYYSMWNTGLFSNKTPNFEGNVNLTALEKFSDFKVSWDGGSTASLSQGGKDVYTFEVDPNNLKSDKNSGNAIYTITDDTKGYYYSVPQKNNLYAAYTLIANTWKDITSFSINGYGGEIDNRNSTITVSLRGKADLSKLAPVIEFTGKSVSPASGESANFTGPVVYTVTDANGQTKKYTVTVSKSSGGGGSGSSSSPSSSFTVTTSAGEGGTISGSAKSVASGDDVVIKIKPDSLYKIKDVTVDGVSVYSDLVFDGNNASFTLKSVAKDKTVKAIFEKLPVSVSDAFTDISGHWARQYIDYVVGKGLLTGTSATSFSPELSVNRAMIVTVLWRLEGKPSATGSVSFKDVNGSDYYRDAVNWAVEKGIVKGRSGSTFDPNADVSRQEIAVFLYRYASYKGKGTDKTGNLTGYADKGSISDWALSAMDSVVGGGIITGRGANTLAPQGSAKRGEFAAMLYRYCN